MPRTLRAVGAIFLTGSVVLTGCSVASDEVYQLGEAPFDQISQVSDDSDFNIAPDLADISAELNAEVVTERMGAALAGVNASAYVYDPFADQAVFDLNGQQPMVPASTVKLLTGIAAMEVLGADKVFTTDILLDGQQLILRGGGDVMVGRGASDSEAVSGRAGMGTLTADALAQLPGPGDYTVRVDTSRYTGPQLNEHWDEDMVTTGNIAPIVPVSTYGGRVTDGTKATRVPDPAESAGRALIEELEAIAPEGYTFEMTEASNTPAPADARQLASANSAPVAELVPYMIAESENQLAEALGREIAIASGRDASFTGATEALEAIAHQVGVAGEMTLVDTSGLSEDNRISANQLVTMLSYSDVDPVLSHAIMDGLAVGGVSGTLAERFTEPPTYGVVRAKTGTLYAGITLAGQTVTVGGRPVWFAILVDGQGTTVADARAAIDAAVTELTSCGC